MGTPILPVPEKNCETCGTPLERKRYNGRLEDRGVFLRRRFCNLSCSKVKASVQANSHRWRARRVMRPTVCETCGTTVDLHIHHKDRDVTNNRPENLASLCSSCHLKLHWREDRAVRMASISARTRQPSSDGSRYLAGPLPPLPSLGETGRSA